MPAATAPKHAPRKRAVRKVATTPPPKLDADLAQSIHLVTLKTLIERAWELEASLPPGVRKIVDRIDKDIKPRIREQVDLMGWPAGHTQTVRGKLGMAIIGGKTIRRSFADMRAVHAAMGDEAFYAACSLSIEAVEKAIGAGRTGLLLAEAVCGARPITLAAVPPDDAEADEA